MDQSQTTAAEYRALITASTGHSGLIPDDLGPSLAAKGYAEQRPDGTFRVTLAGMDHVGH